VHFNENKVSYKRLHTKSRIESDLQENLEMACLLILYILGHVTGYGSYKQ